MSVLLLPLASLGLSTHVYLHEYTEDACINGEAPLIGFPEGIELGACVRMDLRVQPLGFSVTSDRRAFLFGGFPSQATQADGYDLPVSVSAPIYAGFLGADDDDSPLGNGWAALPWLSGDEWLVRIYEDDDSEEVDEDVNVDVRYSNKQGREDTMYQRASLDVAAFSDPAYDTEYGVYIGLDPRTLQWRHASIFGTYVKITAVADDASVFQVHVSDSPSCTEARGVTVPIAVDRCLEHALWSSTGDAMSLNTAPYTSVQGNGVQLRATDEQSETGLSGGIIAAIVAGVVVCCGIAGLLVCAALVAVRKRRAVRPTGLPPQPRRASRHAVHRRSSHLGSVSSQTPTRV